MKITQNLERELRKRIVCISAIIFILAGCKHTSVNPNAPQPAQLTPTAITENNTIKEPVLQTMIMKDQTVFSVTRIFALYNWSTVSQEKMAKILDQNLKIRCNPLCTIERK